MKKNGRKILAAVLILAMAAAFTGCNAEKTATAAPEAASETAAAAGTAAAETKQEAQQTAASSEQTAAAEETESQEEAESLPVQPAEHLQLEVTSTSEGLTDKEDYYSKATIRYAGVLLNAEEAELYPELQAALTAYNGEVTEKYRNVKEQLSATYKEVTDARPEEKGQLQLSNEQELYVMRSDSGLLSLLTYTFAYYGGAHPDHFYGSAVYSSSDGKKLGLKDIVSNMDELIILADRKLQKEYADVYAEFYSTAEAAIRAADTQDSQMAWTAGYEGLTLYFNPYCLGAYAIGEQIVTIYYEEAPGLFQEFVTAVPESYAVPAAEGQQPAVDAVGTGIREAVYVTEDSLGEENGSYNYTIHCGERSCRLEDYCYSQISYLVKANGQYYVYIFETSDNDYVMCSVVDLKTMVRNESLMFNGSIPLLETGYETNIEGYLSWQKKPAFTDPEDFSLATHVNYLSTQSGIKNYHAGMNGWPVAEEEYYTLTGTRVLRVKKELTVDVVSEDGTVTGTEKLSPDTYLYFIRTDDLTFADLQKTDASGVEGTITEWYELYETKEQQEADWTKPAYRIREDKSNWPYTIDGVPEDEVLGGIMYAG